MANLLTNAIKFSEDGDVVVLLKRAEPRFNTICATLTASDTGIGIPAEAQAKLFAPFTQADRNTSIRYGGTGLGLVIVDRIVKLLGGTIDFTSQEGVGTTFNVNLELEKAVSVSIVPALEEGGASVKYADAYPDAQVLVAEDDLVNRSIIISMLKCFQIVPDVAVNGREALACCIRGTYAHFCYEQSGSM